MKTESLRDVIGLGVLLMLIGAAGIWSTCLGA